jgi:hypothetical protein
LERLKFTPEDLVKFTKVVDIQTLRPHPENAKIHDDAKIEASLGAHGQFRTIVISNDSVVLAGNGTYFASMKRGRRKMAVIELPLAHDTTQAREILAVDNGSFLPEFDKGLLESLLGIIVEQGGDLEASGYDDKFLADLIKLNSEPQTPLDVDDKSDKPLPEGFSIIITCENEQQQTELLERFQQDGLKVKALVA